MIKIIVFVCGIIISLLLMTASGENHNTPSSIKPYTIKHFYKNNSSCNSKNEKGTCASIEITYPVFNTSIGNFSASQLNEIIQKDHIVYTAYDDSTAHGVTAFSEKFFNDFREFNQSNEVTTGDWELNKNINVGFLNSTILTLKDEENAYTGGAHGFSRVTWFCFNIKSMKELTLQDILLSKKKNQLTSIAEGYFRKFHGLSANENLEKAGFDFPNNHFALSDNFALLKKGLLFYYNSYDIAAYVFGPTEIFIPYEELSGVINLNLLDLSYSK